MLTTTQSQSLLGDNLVLDHEVPVLDVFGAFEHEKRPFVAIRMVSRFTWDV